MLRITPRSCCAVTVGLGSGVLVILSSHSPGGAQQRFLEAGGVIEVGGLCVVSVFSFPAEQTVAERDDLNYIMIQDGTSCHASRAKDVRECSTK